MGHRLSKIYTRTGDQGQTGLGDGTRVSKDDLRIHALGDIDELNASMGVLISFIQQKQHADNFPKQQWLHKLNIIQHWLFDLGGEVCIPNYQVLQQDYIDALEQDIDRINEQLPMLKEFILPSGDLVCSQCHVVRAVCRRAERQLIALNHDCQNIQPIALQLLNRLSDWLFVAGRLLQKQLGGDEVLWQKGLASQFNQQP
ncbi:MULTISPECIES: cob(I)yrinic acid a,c-diamide adenosyltransferase [unclassified Acinetobacter]|uniref:cob(I)yrinic acid a,c-diamide adenosyltransferase n=1 Tax=unclassified Acinetobacter TaxID=196816 RepID=UPI0035BA1F1A